MIFICVLIFSIAGRFGTVHQYFELASHFRLYNLFGAVLCLLVFGYFQAWPWAFAAATFVTLTGVTLVPWYMRPRAAESGGDGDGTLRVLFANVEHTNADYALFIELVREEDPDLVVAQEVTDQWIDGLKALCGQYPHTVTVPLPKGDGIALFSRIGFASSEVVYIGSDVRPGIFVRVAVRETIVSMFSIHPDVPIFKRSLHHRNEQLAAGAAFAANLAGPCVVIGDFNASLWSPYFAEFVRASNLVNARKGFGLLPTWPVWLRLPFLMLPIDQCLVSRDVRVERLRTARSIGSDHLPLVVDLAFPSR